MLLNLQEITKRLYTGILRFVGKPDLLTDFFFWSKNQQNRVCSEFQEKIQNLIIMKIF